LQNTDKIFVGNSDRTRRKAKLLHLLEWGRNK